MFVFDGGKTFTEQVDVFLQCLVIGTGSKDVSLLSFLPPNQETALGLFYSSQLLRLWA